MIIITPMTRNKRSKCGVYDGEYDASACDSSMVRHLRRYWQERDPVAAQRSVESSGARKARRLASIKRPVITIQLWLRFPIDGHE
jgi:hypothetical protein